MSNKKRVLICGLGNMGKAVLWSMNSFGFHTIALDSNSKSIEGFSGGSFDFLIIKEEKDLEKAVILSKPDIVISSLPYHQTEQLAIFCIRKGVAYCDLGGKMSVSEKIALEAHANASQFVFTDLGLAPGWVNILTEHGCKQFYERNEEIEEIKMMVGGIPVNARNPPLNYVVSWSIDGLINEYKDSCKILKDKAIVSVEGMEGLENVETLSFGALEAFYTSGAISHTLNSVKDRGVKNCSYKTLRHKGHCEIVKFLIRKCQLDNECLDKVFRNGCAPHKGKILDAVIIKVIIKGKHQTWDKEILVGYGNGIFSAMQKATAFSISSVAKMILDGKFNKENQSSDIFKCGSNFILGYKDIDYGVFMENLNFLRRRINDNNYERN